MPGCEWCRVEELDTGVYALIDVDGGWFRSNTGLIDAGDYTIVVDTQYNEPRAKAVRSIIEELGLPRPGLVINTHHHGDHAWGNHVFEAISIMHEQAASLVEALKDVAPDIYKPFFPQLDFTGSKYTIPNIAVGDRVVVNTPRGRLIVRHMGPAHTIGDIVVELSRSNIVFAGDLVFNKVTPLAIDGSVKEWINALEALRREYRGYTIVGGHGPLAGEDVLETLIAYLRHVMEGTSHFYRLGVRDPLEVAKRIGNGPISDWSEGERIVLNIARAFMDLEGQPPGSTVDNLPELAQKMMLYKEARGYSTRP
ncbi:MAG: MBL fold metallo-hydrolase [Desulfurococcales archaeon]|nr:MBL fold metallo-hydrolase [Desulfurococcales archaeon]